MASGEKCVIKQSPRSSGWATACEVHKGPQKDDLNQEKWRVFPLTLAPPSSPFPPLKNGHPGVAGGVSHCVPQASANLLLQR